MSGKNFIFAFLSVIFIFTVLLFYFQNYAYYEPIEKQESVLLGNKSYEVSEYQGIDSKSSGLKLRECFSAEDADLIQLLPYKKPTPLIAPFWFNCFNAEKITKDLKDGAIKNIDPAPIAIIHSAMIIWEEELKNKYNKKNKKIINKSLSKKDEFDGIDSVIAIYPDGRVYRWRQLNNKYLKD